MEDDRRFVARDLLRQSLRDLAMPLTFRLSGHLKAFTGGKVELLVPGEHETLAEALTLLWKMHPALRDRILTETGEIRQHVNIFAGSVDIKRSNGLQTKPRGNDIYIFNAVSGG